MLNGVFPTAVYSGMLLMILIALAGLSIGALAGWILAGSRSGAEKRRADTLANAGDIARKAGKT